MPSRVRFFSINADDVDRARRFYEAVTGWRYEPWGPPDFYITRPGGPDSALQERRELGGRPQGVEVTIGVENLAATVAAIEANGGRLVTQPYKLEGVGEIAYFEDTEGNILGACQYEREEDR